MTIERVPAFSITPLQDTTQVWRLVEAEKPVDWTATYGGVGYTAEIVISRCGKVYHRSPVALDADGFLTATIPASVAQELRSARLVDAQYQIQITAPMPDQSEVWEGNISVDEVFE